MDTSLQQERKVILTRLRSRIAILFWVSSVTLCVAAFITFWLTLGPGPGMLALTLIAILCFLGYWMKWVLFEIVPDLYRLRTIADAEKIKYDPARGYSSEIIPTNEIVPDEDPLNRAYYSAQFH